MKRNSNLKLRFTYACFFVISFLAFVSVANADSFGQDQGFFISSGYDAQGRSQITATLRKVSSHAYFYVEDGYWNSISSDAHNQISSQIDTLAQEFDNRIYPIETNFFGSEPNPGIDDDPHMVILLSPLIEKAGGYFDTANEYTRNQIPDSNQREMIYVNINGLADPQKVDPFLAHEFQHLISFNQKELLRQVSDENWLNELRSEYATILLGYSDNFPNSYLAGRVKTFLSSSDDSLTEWKNLPPDYGQIILFAEYIAEHFSAQVIADTLKNNLSAGIASINDALAKNGFPQTFSDIYSDWLIANLLNNTSIDTLFGYTRESLKNLHVNPSRVLNNIGDDITLVFSDNIKDWQGKWYDISQFAPGQNNVLKISFSSPSLASFHLVYLILKPDGSISRPAISIFSPTNSSSDLYLNGIGSNIGRVILIPLKEDQIAGFTANEQVVNLLTSVERIKTMPVQPPVLSTIIQPAPKAAKPAALKIKAKVKKLIVKSKKKKIK